MLGRQIGVLVVKRLMVYLIMGLLELNDYLRDNTPDIVGITETKLEHLIEAVNIGFGKYDVYRRDRKGKKGGGVALLVKKGF